MKRKRKIMVLSAADILCGLILWPSPAHATMITIEIEAVVDSVRDEGGYLEGKINPGDIITGSYTYDLSMVDSNPSSGIGVYEYRMVDVGMSLSVAGYEFATDTTSPWFFVETRNNWVGSDAYWFISVNNVPMINGIGVTLYWILEDSTETALGSDALPTGAPALEAYDYNVLGIVGGDWRAGGTFTIEGHVTSAIPEPCTILLFGSCGVMLVRRNKN